MTIWKQLRDKNHQPTRPKQFAPPKTKKKKKPRNKEYQHNNAHIVRSMPSNSYWNQLYS